MTRVCLALYLSNSSGGSRHRERSHPSSAAIPAARLSTPGPFVAMLKLNNISNFERASRTCLQSRSAAGGFSAFELLQRLLSLSRFAGIETFSGANDVHGGDCGMLRLVSGQKDLRGWSAGESLEALKLSGTQDLQIQVQTYANAVAALQVRGESS